MSKDISPLINPSVESTVDRLSGNSLKCFLCGTPMVPSLTQYNNMKGVYIATITCPKCYGEFVAETVKDE